MNLKEGFRYQNKIDEWIGRANGLLLYTPNVTITTQEHFKSKANPDEAKDETVVVERDGTLTATPDEIIDLLILLLNEKEKLTKAISVAKRALPIDIDGSILMNKKRQEISRVFTTLGNMKDIKRIVRGTGQKFNVEGNQTNYYYDIEEKITTNFDKEKVKSFSKESLKHSDSISSEIDLAMINVNVKFEPPYDVNDTFDDILDIFTKK